MKSEWICDTEVMNLVNNNEPILCPFSDEKHRKSGNCLAAMICIVPVFMLLLILLSL
jgi:hypothetical protein